MYFQTKNILKNNTCYYNINGVLRATVPYTYVLK